MYLKIGTIILIVIILVYIFCLFYTYNLCCNITNNKSEYKLDYLNKKKILIITIETRDLKILDIHNKNVLDYSNKHNYKYIFLKNYKNDLELPVYWWKIQSVLDILNNNIEEYDYVLWLDSDAFFVDDEIPLESLIDKYPNYSIYIGKDCYSLLFTNAYCSGVFIIKNNKISKDFLSDCIKMYTETSFCKVDNKYTLKGLWARDCYEQGIMNKLLNTKYKNDVFHIPNSFVFNNTFPIQNTVISHVYGGDKNDCYNKITNFFNLKK